MAVWESKDENMSINVPQMTDYHFLTTKPTFVSRIQTIYCYIVRSGRVTLITTNLNYLPRQPI